MSLDREVLKSLENYANDRKINSLSAAAENILRKGLGVGKVRQAVIMAGGQAKRLRPFTYEFPKPLMPLQGKAIIEHSFALLKKYGVEEVIIALGYLADKMKEALGDGSRYGLKFIYVEEKSPLGTAGSLILAKKYLTGPFFLVWADVLIDIDLDDLAHYHRQNRAIGTMALATVDDITDLGVIELQGGLIKKFIEKPDPKNTTSHLINAGLVLFELSVFDFLPKRVKAVSIEREVYPQIVAKNKLAGYPFQGAWFDTGTPDRYERALKKWHIK
ncbi:MAG: nucleotidyltransferase family protein [Patescibacteria group bacterium]|nr:nucleotidyltransferase family protein [Patescibacteria group bacterium]